LFLSSFFTLNDLILDIEHGYSFWNSTHPNYSAQLCTLPGPRGLQLFSPTTAATATTAAATTTTASN
jgi:hypothetical protein